MLGGVSLALGIGVVTTAGALAAQPAAASFPSAAASAARAPHGARYGEFTFRGAIVGTLRPLATTCGASRGIASLEFIWFGGVTTLKGVPPKSNVSIEIDLGRSRYGRAGRFTNVVGKPPYLAFSAEGIGTKSISWRSVSGRFATSKKGASGSIDVSMAPTGTTKGDRLTIRGGWKSCG